jgi:hypothetical protein
MIPYWCLTNASCTLATGEYLECHSLSPIRLKRGVGGHQAEDLRNGRHVPLNFALDLVLGILRCNFCA